MADSRQDSGVGEAASGVYIMNRCFTHYWTNDTWDHNKRVHGPGQLLDHTAGNLFRARKVATGDAIYVVTVRKGRLFLLGRLIVAKVCDAREAAQALGCKEEDLWEAKDHVVAALATAMRFDLEVPLAITQRLLFVGSKSRKPLRFVQPGTLDTQALRGVRQLDDASARSLDGLLPSDRIVELHHSGPKR